MTPTKIMTLKSLCPKSIHGTCPRKFLVAPLTVCLRLLSGDYKFSNVYIFYVWCIKSYRIDCTRFKSFKFRVMNEWEFVSDFFVMLCYVMLCYVMLCCIIVYWRITLKVKRTFVRSAVLVYTRACVTSLAQASYV